MIHGKYFNSWESLGIAYIVAYLKKHVNNVDISFFQGSFDDKDHIISECIKSDIVCFSCTTPAFGYCIEIAEYIKNINKNIRTVMGGYHASSLSSQVLDSGVIDQVVIGDGEKAIVEIVNGNRDKTIDGKRMTFDELLWPDRDFIKNERNIGVALKETGKRIASFQSHRGCPFLCKYCSDGYEKVLYPESKQKKTDIELRDINDLLEEMISVTKKYFLDLLKFCDATWNTDKNYVKKFCEKKNQLNFSTEFFANIHANIVDDEMFNLMKKANCNSIGLGIESGSPKILKQIGKGTTRETIYNAVCLAKKNGIFTRGYFILGMPDETEEDLKLTDEFAENLDLDEYGFTILCPYPGTEMFSSYNNELSNIDWSTTDEYTNNFWHTKTLTNQDLKKWQRYFITKFSNRITWHNREINGK